MVGWRRASLGKSVRMGKQVRCVAGMGTVVVGVRQRRSGRSGRPTMTRPEMWALATRRKP